MDEKKKKNRSEMNKFLLMCCYSYERDQTGQIPAGGWRTHLSIYGYIGVRLRSQMRHAEAEDLQRRWAYNVPIRGRKLAAATAGARCRVLWRFDGEQRHARDARKGTAIRDFECTSIKYVQDFRISADLKLFRFLPSFLHFTPLQFQILTERTNIPPTEVQEEYFTFKQNYYRFYIPFKTYHIKLTFYIFYEG